MLYNVPTKKCKHILTVEKLIHRKIYQKKQGEAATIEE